MKSPEFGQSIQIYLKYGRLYFVPYEKIYSRMPACKLFGLLSGKRPFEVSKNKSKFAKYESTQLGMHKMMRLATFLFSYWHEQDIDADESDRWGRFLFCTYFYGPVIVAVDPLG